MMPAFRPLVLALAAVALAGCAGLDTAQEARACQGTPFVLNAGLWTPAPEDLR
ncbi:type IV secretion system lipoprotein VirB7 [Pseudoroseomonas sp. WGS1072]|uniref:type IV secretion system lipoprotein VirB7 n=1 Tax=Roseomonas sp. WGS1072 TaxID=3366816 RepID=UPI003BF2B68A